MHAYEAAILGRYARNLLLPGAGKSSYRRGYHNLSFEALAWLSRYRKPLSVPPHVFLDAFSPAQRAKGLEPRQLAAILEQNSDSSDYFEEEIEASRNACSRAAKSMKAWARTSAPELPSRKSPLQRRIAQIVETLGLSEIEGDVLGLLMRINSDAAFCQLTKGIFDNEWESVPRHQFRVDLAWDEVATTLHLNAADISRLKGLGSQLRQFGLTTGCQQDAELSDPSLHLLRLSETRQKVSIFQTMMGRQCRSSETVTTWDDFVHLGAARDVALKLLQGALAEKAKGVVILLHGPPGTGKTAFAQTLIQKAGAKGWMVGENDADGSEASRSERLSSLLLASALSRTSSDAVLVLDEADDVFNDGASSFKNLFAPATARDGSKVFMNRVLEDLGSPTILVVNKASNLGDAIVRRTSLAIEIKTPSVELSAKIAARVLARQKLNVSAQTITDLAQSGTPFGVMALAARTAKLTGGGADHVKLAARSVTRMLHVKKKPVSADLAGMGFDPAFANADCNLVQLADCAVASGKLALSFCLYGAPGTGKSAFARWIAGRMGLEVIEKRGSDLLGMYVGETEKNIADAFEEATDREAFLIFDEADSLLSDRSRADKSWQVSKVNEMLTWMERHPLPFAATTNLMAGLDPAALRRFLFKAEFKALLPEQAEALFERTFGCEAPTGLAKIDMLAPGDFAVVARKSQILGIRDPHALLAALHSEVALKPGAGKVRVGF